MTIEATPKTVVQIGGTTAMPKRVSTSPHAAPAATQDDAVGALRQLLRIETEIRSCRSVDELSVLLVTEMRKMMGARSAYFIALHSGKPRVTKVSGGGDFDRNAPTIRWLEKELKACLPRLGWETASPLSLRVGPDAQGEDARAFPFPEGYWLPLRHENSKPEFGVLVVAEQLFSEGSIAIGDHIAAAAAHAGTVLVRKSPRPKMRFRYRLLLYTLCLAATAAMFYPVPMTALAPMRDDSPPLQPERPPEGLSEKSRPRYKPIMNAGTGL